MPLRALLALSLSLLVVDGLLLGSQTIGVQRNGRKMTSLKMVTSVGISKGLLTIPVLYAAMSVNEYITHRYYQHAGFNNNRLLQTIFKGLKISGGGHIEHHAETLDDMSLRTDARWLVSPAARVLSSDPYRGTAFSWPVAALMLIQMLVTTLPIFLNLFKFTISQTLMLVVPSLLLHVSIWNCLHPNMHYLPDVPASFGPASKWMMFLKNTSYFKFIFQNHEGHHVLGGAANYNVCCPGADHLFGTYAEEVSWRPKAQAVAATRETNKQSLIPAMV